MPWCADQAFHTVRSDGRASRAGTVDDGNLAYSKEAHIYDAFPLQLKGGAATMATDSSCEHRRGFKTGGNLAESICTQRSVPQCVLPWSLPLSCPRYLQRSLARNAKSVQQLRSTRPWSARP